MYTHAFSFRLTGLGILAALLSQSAFADFIKDSSVTLTARNFYLDRDYKGETPYAAAREWAQGFIVKANSGFTDGPVGFGLDMTGLLGLKLDSSPDRTGTQLLAYNPVTREARDEYSELGLALKGKVSKTRVSLGTQFPALPVINASPARLLPQSFRGAYLISDDIDRLTVHAGRMDRVNLRDSTDYQPMAVASPNGRFRPGATSERFDFYGGDYRWTDSLTVRLIHAELQDIYRQDFFGVLHTLPFGAGKVRSDIRVFNSREDGQAKAGNVDNLNIGGMFSYLWGGHSVGIGYMRQSGDTAFPYIAGGEPVVLSDGTMSADFVNPRERTWALRYDYDFAASGIPGLTGMVRYLHGDNIDLPALGGSNLSESSKDLELAYVIQSGPAKGLAFRVREAFYRNQQGAASTFRSDNETRINVDYTLKVW
ncbi:outer membrane porin, OprD family [Pseudomonas alkylphenolica]|uniref:Outer membrane porin, OprD family n=1 Tax=Pseudomonas alkylphenolica TaxID=237609 RepID=A0A443ZF03_9PSED|nr:OprD family porin [Pseudomonas alkylphenolica]RWU17132.1 outer membrane porin, OprD family [Pseudomonas alkylphenolica]